MILAGLVTIDGRLIRVVAHRQPKAIRIVTMATFRRENLS